MKIKNFDYQSIIPFEDHYGKSTYNPKKCFYYYKKRTNSNINYSLKQTFLYIENYYRNYNYSDKMTASEINGNTNMLLNKLCNLDYDNKISFSVISSIVLSLIISIFIASLQTSGTEFENNYFDVCNNVLHYANTQLVASAGFFEAVINVIFYILTIVILASIIVVFAIGLPTVVRHVYYATVYKRTFIDPYERDIVKRTLSTYDKKYEKID